MLTAHTSADPSGLSAGVGWRGFGLAGIGIANALLLVWGSALGSSAGRALAAVLAATSVGGAALLWIALDEKDWYIITDEVPHPFGRVEFHRETADVACAIAGTA